MKRGPRSTPAGQHRPVLLAEILSALEPRPGETAVDCTLGWAGHAVPLLERLGPAGRLIGIDFDPENLSRARERLEAVPFIEQFARKIEQAVASGNAASARGDLDKIRSLDPDHPALARLEQAIGQGSAPAQSFVVDSPSQPSSRGSTPQKCSRT